MVLLMLFHKTSGIMNFTGNDQIYMLFVDLLPNQISMNTTSLAHAGGVISFQNALNENHTLWQDSLLASLLIMAVMKC